MNARFLVCGKSDSGQARKYTTLLHRCTGVEVHTDILSQSPAFSQRLDLRDRQNSIHQAFAEIDRVHKTIHILETLDDEEYRRRIGCELNKGEASHALSRFPCFGKEGHLRAREFGDQLHTFGCLSVLHNAVVAWSTLHIGRVVKELRAEGYVLDEATLALTSPLFHKPINPYERYHFDLDRMRQTLDPMAQGA